MAAIVKMTSQKKTHGKRLYMVYEEKFVIKLFPANVPLHIETSKLICIANQFIDSYLSLGNWGGGGEWEVGRGVIGIKKVNHEARFVINPFHATDLFRYPLMFSRGIERDQWHEMG